MGPSACNWIIGTQESHEKALQIGWEGFHRALEQICSVRRGLWGLFEKTGYDGLYLPLMSRYGLELL